MISSEEKERIFKEPSFRVLEETLAKNAETVRLAIDKLANTNDPDKVLEAYRQANDALAIVRCSAIKMYMIHFNIEL